MAPLSEVLLNLVSGYSPGSTVLGYVLQFSLSLVNVTFRNYNERVIEGW